MKAMLVGLTGCTLLTACGDQAALSQQPGAESTVSNVILMIGDGMGAQQIGLLEEYARRAPNSSYHALGNETGMQKFAKAGHLGLSLTAPMGADNTLVVD